MGRHRVYSARARGAFAPRAGQQRCALTQAAGGWRGSIAGAGWNAARAAKTTRMWQAAAKRRRFMCFPRDSARVCCEERAQARRQAHHASRLVVARKESSALMWRTAGRILNVFVFCNPSSVLFVRSSAVSSRCWPGPPPALSLACSVLSNIPSQL